MNDSDAEPSHPAAPPARKPRKSPGRKRAPATEQPAGDKPTSQQGPASAPADTAPAPPATVELILTPLPVRWRDLDAFNHVNNSKYLSFLEEARLRWMMSLPGQGLEDDVAPVVAAATLNYRRPIAWPAEVMVQLFVQRLGNSSVTIGHRIADAHDPDVLYCDGHVVLVWIGRDNGRAAPLPDAVRRSCSVH